MKRQPIKIDQRETESTARSFPENRTCSIFNQLVYSRYTVQILRTFFLFSFFFPPNVANQFVSLHEAILLVTKNASSARPVVVLYARAYYYSAAPVFPRFSRTLWVSREKCIFFLFETRHDALDYSDLIFTTGPRLSRIHFVMWVTDFKRLSTKFSYVYSFFSFFLLRKEI